MMTTGSEIPDTADWIRWIIGAWITLTAGVFIHVYAAIDKIRRTAELGNQPEIEKLRTTMENMRESMEEKLEQVRKETETDRRLAAADRTTIAERMVTRTELDRQIDRVLVEVDKIRSSNR